MKQRTEQFYVPAGFAKEFATLIQLYKLNNVIMGLENDDIVVFVHYTDGQKQIIDFFHEQINQYNPDRRPEDIRYTEVEALRVPEPFMGQVAALISKYNLKNSIAGGWATESRGWIILIVVTYEIHQQRIVDEIIKKIETYERIQKDDRWKLNGLSKLRKLKNS